MCELIWRNSGNEKNTDWTATVHTTYIVVVEDNIRTVNWNFEVVCKEPYFLPFCDISIIWPGDWESLRNLQLAWVTFASGWFHLRRDISYKLFSQSDYEIFRNKTENMHMLSSARLQLITCRPEATHQSQNFTKYILSPKGKKEKEQKNCIYYR